MRPLQTPGVVEPAAVVSCTICGENQAWPLVHQRNAEAEALGRQAGDAENYSWSLCCRCANAYPSIPPRSDVLDRIWRSSRNLERLGVAPDAEDIWADRTRVSRLWASRSYSMLAPLHVGPPGRFLDIACGLGGTVKLFQDRGWKAFGIDVDASTKPFHERLGIETRIGRIEDIGIDGTFDIIHIAHAIYFVSDVIGFLRDVRAHLAPGGIFAVWISDFLAATDPGYPNYAHTFYPTKSSMRYALALADFIPSPPRSRSGSVFITARPGRTTLPSVRPRLIRVAYETKPLRYRLFGRPYLFMRQIAKQVVNFAGRRVGRPLVL